MKLVNSEPSGFNADNLHQNLLTVRFRGHVRCLPCPHGLANPQAADGGGGLQMWRVATADKGGPPAEEGVESGCNNFSPYKNKLVTKCHEGPRTWTVLWINDLS
jgi:hypothetical protein